jgi:hypothetical protein
MMKSVAQQLSSIRSIVGLLEILKGEEGNLFQQ